MVYLENVAAEVAGLRVVGGVQADGFAVVVHGHVNMAANGLLNAGAGAAAATANRSTTSSWWTGSRN